MSLGTLNHRPQFDPASSLKCRPSLCRHLWQCHSESWLLQPLQHSWEKCRPKIQSLHDSSRNWTIDTKLSKWNSIPTIFSLLTWPCVTCYKPLLFDWSCCLSGQFLVGSWFDSLQHSRCLATKEPPLGQFRTPWQTEKPSSLLFLASRYSGMAFRSKIGKQLHLFAFINTISIVWLLSP